MHLLGRHRRGRVLELGEGGAVRRDELLRERRLHDGEGLADLHRTALELTEHREQLVRGAGLQLLGHELGRLAAHPLAERPGGPAGESERERGELRGARHPAQRQIRHWRTVAIVTGAPSSSSCLPVVLGPRYLAVVVWWWCWSRDRVTSSSPIRHGAAPAHVIVAPGPSGAALTGR